MYLNLNLETDPKKFDFDNECVSCIGLITVVLFKRR